MWEKSTQHSHTNKHINKISSINWKPRWNQHIKLRTHRHDKKEKNENLEQKTGHVFYTRFEIQTKMNDRKGTIKFQPLSLKAKEHQLIVGFMLWITNLTKQRKRSLTFSEKKLKWVKTMAWMLVIPETELHFKWPNI